jgi:hypothetical protein
VQGHKGNLVLVAGQSRTNLVNVDTDDPEARARGKKRVVPGNSGASFLVHKLDQSPALLQADEGDPMPQVGQRLEQQKIDAIKAWIDQGALDN